MARLNTTLFVFFLAVLATATAHADTPTVNNLRHQSSELARNAAVPIVSPPSYVLASRTYEAGSLWVDEGVAAEQWTVNEDLAAEQSAVEVAEADAAHIAETNAALAVASAPRLGAATAVEQDLAAAAAEIRYPTNGARVLHRWHAHLDALATTLRQNPEIRVELVGHTDTTGDDDHNQWLSLRRAERFRAHLVERGVEPERMTVIGAGASQPLGANETDEGRQLNRRVEVRVAR